MDRGSLALSFEAEEPCVPEVYRLFAQKGRRLGIVLLGQQNHPAPRVINTDGHAAYPPAIAQLKSEGTLDSGCQHRPVPYLN